MRRPPRAAPHRLTGKDKAKRPPEPDYLTIDEFCLMFAISRQTWRRHRPYLRTILFGARTLIPRDEALRYVESLARPAQKVRRVKGLAAAP